MKITALEINNIASIDGCYQINFESEPLNSVGLFAITGATGAGKSTILDAICLALYNKTPRLAPLTTTVQIIDTKDKTISNKDVKTLLRKGAIQGHVKVTFLGVDGKYYRSEWHIRRANNRVTGAIQNESILLYNITDETEFPENRKTLVLQEIERLIGLKYEQFTKSVILAQGEFTAFLKADDNNRADILEKLTGTDIYSKISRNIFDKYRFYKKEIETLNTQLEMFQLLSDDDIENLNLEIEQLNEQINTIKQQLVSLNGIQDWYKKEKIFVEEIDKITIELNQRKEQLVTEKNRINHFKLVENFQTIKEEAISYQRKKTEKENQESILKNIIQDIENQENNINQLNNNLKKYHTEFQEIQKQINNNIPLYNEVRKLDVKIEIGQNNYLEKLNIVSDLEIKSKQIKDTYQQKIERANQLTFQQNQITSWFEQNQIYESFVINENLILAYLKEAEDNKNKIPAEEQKIKDLDFENTKMKPLFNSKELEKKELENQEKEISIQIRNLNAILEKQNLSELENDKKNLIAARELKNSQVLLFKSLIEQNKLISESKARFTDYKNKQNQLIKELNGIENELKESKIKKDTLKVILDKLLLEKSENVVSLRENLNNKEACPVCGSLDHPFVTHNPLAKVTNETANAYEELELKIDFLNKEQLTLNQQFIQIEEKILQVEEIETNAKLLVEKIQEETKDIYSELKELNAIEIHDTIENELKTINFAIENIEINLDSLRKQWYEKEQLQGKVLGIQQNIQILSQNLYDISTQLNQINHNKQLVFEGIEQKKQSYNRQISEVSNILQNNQWFDLWNKNPKEFMQIHSKIAQDWRTNQLNFDKITEGQIQVKIEIQEIEKLIEVKDKENEKARHNLINIQNELENLKKERQLFFNGESVDSIEKNLSIIFENLRETIETKKQLAIDLNNQMIGFQSNKKATEDNINATLQNITENESIIQKWASKMNLSYENTLSFLKYDTEWIQNERDLIQNIYTQISKQEALFEDKNIALQNHTKTNKPEISEVEVTQLIQDNEENIKLTNEKALANKHNLQSDSEKRKSQKSLIEKKNNVLKIANKWSQLNDLIGSADGSKFKKIAQEYTLDILLRYANIHLEKINRRYVLERIPNTLSLQVIDNDMACEIRSVHSLSGGESFLVSLALALALSSLSSSKMNIQSLFIDEGFGTLDAQILAVAMDALESLQNQGKKVGVISHVSEMTERIPVQIHVEKLGNGRSSIETINLFERFF